MPVETSPRPDALLYCRRSGSAPPAPSADELSGEEVDGHASSGVAKRQRTQSCGPYAGAAQPSCRPIKRGLI